jgi:hypothetical protein
LPQDRTGNTQATASHLANPSEIANLTFAPNHAIAFPSVGKEEVLDSYNYLELYVFLLADGSIECLLQVWCFPTMCTKEEVS